jgi:ribulose-phosphate 3-epimerase
MQNVWQEKCIFSPSLICLDQCNLERDVKELEQAGIKMLHIDILDGLFSPSMPLGLEAVKQLRDKTDMFFDCHLMTRNTDFFIDELLAIGVQHICLHSEGCSHIDGTLSKIHEAGILAGLALKPSTSLSDLFYIIEKCDSVMLMLINPGYAGNKAEKQVAYANKKINDLRAMINDHKLNTKIIIDGRVSIQNIIDYGKDAVDIFVCGSTCGITPDTIHASVSNLFTIRSNL